MITRDSLTKSISNWSLYSSTIVLMRATSTIHHKTPSPRHKNEAKAKYFSWIFPNKNSEDRKEATINMQRPCSSSWIYSAGAHSNADSHSACALQSILAVLTYLTCPSLLYSPYSTTPFHHPISMINRIHPTKKFHKFSFILLQISPP